MGYFAERVLTPACLAGPAATLASADLELCHLSLSISEADICDQTVWTKEVEARN